MALILETPRLTLQPFTLQDAALLHAMFTDAFVRRYLWDDEIIAREQTVEILEENERHFRSRRWGLWKVVLKADGAVAGFAGLWFFFDEAQPQLLFGLLPSFTKSGYATEAARGVVDYAFRHLNFSRLTASCDAPNTDSRNVCARAGMTTVQEKNMNGKPTVFFTITRSDPS